MVAYWQFLEPRFNAIGIDPDSLRRRSALRACAPGDRVLLAEPDPLRFLNIFFAALIQGCHIFLCDPNWGSDRRQQALNMIQPHQRFDPWPEKAPESRNLIKDMLSLRRMLQGGEAIFIPTGGSSGGLRFAAHTWETLSKAAQAFLDFFSVRDHHVICFLPLHHVSGLQQVTRVLLGGGSIHFAHWTKLKERQEFSIPPDTFISLVPAQLFPLMQESVAVERLRRSRAVILGGGRLSPGLRSAAFAHALPLAPSYGSTETAAMAAALLPKDFLAGRAGIGSELPHARLTFRHDEESDPDTGSPGQILVASESLCHGHLPGGPLRHRDEGWLSGDLGFRDKEGSIHIVGRLDRLINSGGEKIDADEVEALLLDSGLVRDVHVGSLPDERWGERLVVWYVPALADCSPESLKQFASDKLAPYQRPRQWIGMAKLPRSPAGKLEPARLPAE